MRRSYVSLVTKYLEYFIPMLFWCVYDTSRQRQCRSTKSNGRHLQY
jgi:hypothetical protein